MLFFMIQDTFPLTIGEEAVRNERTLLARVEGGRMMDSVQSVRYIVLHCSATRCDRDYTVEQLLRDHRARGFRTIGYHFYIRRDGTLTPRTPRQTEQLANLFRRLLTLFPHARLVGHRDLPGTRPKHCPCLDTRGVFGYLEEE